LGRDGSRSIEQPCLDETKGNRERSLALSCSMRVHSGAADAIWCAMRLRLRPRSGWFLAGRRDRTSLAVTVMGAAHRLPPSFTSSYRLFFRASSASVLHHRVATHYVRTLWKPTFREAAVVIHKLQSPTLGISQKEQLEKWHYLWELCSEFKVDILAPVVKS
jgi:hypothetical protein